MTLFRCVNKSHASLVLNLGFASEVKSLGADGSPRLDRHLHLGFRLLVVHGEVLQLDIRRQIDRVNRNLALRACLPMHLQGELEAAAMSHLVLRR